MFKPSYNQAIKIKRMINYIANIDEISIHYLLREREVFGKDCFPKNDSEFIDLFRFLKYHAKQIV